MAEGAAQEDELRPEYGDALFAGAQRGKYAAKYKSGVNIVKLDPDVADSFPDEQSVNQALRFLKQLAIDCERLTGATPDQPQ